MSESPNVLLVLVDQPGAAFFPDGSADRLYARSLAARPTRFADACTAGPFRRRARRMN